MISVNEATNVVDASYMDELDEDEVSVTVMELEVNLPEMIQISPEVLRILFVAHFQRMSILFRSGR
jgi:hypothetical protein